MRRAVVATALAVSTLASGGVAVAHIADGRLSRDDAKRETQRVIRRDAPTLVSETVSVHRVRAGWCERRSRQTVDCMFSVHLWREGADIAYNPTVAPEIECWGVLRVSRESEPTADDAYQPADGAYQPDTPLTTGVRWSHCEG